MRLHQQAVTCILFCIMKRGHRLSMRDAIAAWENGTVDDASASLASAMVSPPSQLSIEVWGPKAWGMLHIGSFMYPVVSSAADRQRMYSFLHSFAHIIPCERCRTHFQLSLKAHVESVDSPTLAGREALSRYVVDLHNRVNQRLGKRIWRYEDAMSLYTRVGDTCPADLNIVLPSAHEMRREAMELASSEAMATYVPAALSITLALLLATCIAAWFASRFRPSTPSWT